MSPFTPHKTMPIEHVSSRSRAFAVWSCDLRKPIGMRVAILRFLSRERCPTKRCSSRETCTISGQTQKPDETLEGEMQEILDHWFACNPTSSFAKEGGRAKECLTGVTEHSCTCSTDVETVIEMRQVVRMSSFVCILLSESPLLAPLPLRVVRKSQPSNAVSGSPFLWADVREARSTSQDGVNRLR